MSKKDTPKHYWEDDLLFLLLKLIDYPSGNKKSFKFQEVKKLKHEKTTPSQVIKFITELCEQFGDLDFENFVFIPYEDGETKETIENTLSECDIFIQDFPKNSESISYKKIFGQKFEASDLETLARAQLFYNRDRIIKWTNFTINVGGKFRARAILKLENYIDCFKESQLEYKDRENNYYTFENHKTNGFKKIKEISDESENEIVLKDYHFGEKYHFLEFILFLQLYHYIDLKKIDLDKKNHYSAEIIIRKKLLNEEKRSQLKLKGFKKEIIPISIPPKTTWEDIEIEFINEFELEISVNKKHFAKIDHIEMGCFDSKSKDKKADVQWQLLTDLSLSGGKLDFNRCLNEKEINTLKQKKKKLSENLKKKFSLQDDPFFLLPNAGMFQTRFKIKPLQILRGSGELYGIEEN